MLAGAGAEEFALTRGFRSVPRSYFYTEARWRQLERIARAKPGCRPSRSRTWARWARWLRMRAGRLAAATSTGGMTGKRFGRIGDSPMIGAGTYADDRSCAVSATGHGEMFIRAAVAHESAHGCASAARTLAEAVREVVLEELPALGGEGGVIAIDRDGADRMEFNTEGMFRASRVAGGEPMVEHLSRLRSA